MSALPPRLSRDDVASLLARVGNEEASARELLERAAPIAEAAGLTVHSSVLDVTFNQLNNGLAGGASSGSNSNAAASAAPGSKSELMDLRQEAALASQARRDFNPLRGTLSAYPLVLSTTSGHSNTDHIVRTNPDGTVDRFSEYKRRMKRRHRQVRPPAGTNSDRWDLPRIPGGRRRRIRRQADAPSAPPEPPGSGYVLFVSQMTTKLRHDNPKRHHNQISAVRRISAAWNGMDEAGREHYVALARDARAEYDDRMREYRATGGWSPFTTIARLDDNKNGAVCTQERVTHGPWVRIPFERKNELERELDAYEQVIFPPRPAAKEQAHERRVKESLVKRKKKIREMGLKYY